MKVRPPYLRLVPPCGKRFRRPAKAERHPPLPRDGESVASMVKQAELVQAIVDRRRDAVWTNDEIVVKALVDRIEVEARFAAGLARGLREGTLCA